MHITLFLLNVYIAITGGLRMQHDFLAPSEASHVNWDLQTGGPGPAKLCSHLYNDLYWSSLYKTYCQYMPDAQEILMRSKSGCYPELCVIVIFRTISIDAEGCSIAQPTIMVVWRVLRGQQGLVGDDWNLTDLWRMGTSAAQWRYPTVFLILHGQQLGPTDTKIAS